jgi:hypothetical protein
LQFIFKIALCFIKFVPGFGNFIFRYAILFLQTNSQHEDTVEADAAQPEEDADQDENDSSMDDTITRDECTYLCDEVASLSFEIADHRREYREDQLRNEPAHMQTQQLLQSLLERFPPPP